MTEENIDVVEFIRIWEESKTVSQVAEEMTETLEEVLARATRYRTKGVRLKIFEEEPASIGEDPEKKVVQHVVVSKDLDHVNELCSTGWYYLKNAYMTEEGLIFVISRLLKKRH
jgi:hypothetical protein